MAKRPNTQKQGRKKHRLNTRLFRARFPNGTSVQRGHSTRVFTHAYLVLYRSPDGKDGFQRAFCSSLAEAEAKVEAEMRWLSKNRYTFIEAFIVDVQDITSKMKGGKREESDQS